MKAFDKNRPYGLVYGHENAKFYQDGVHFTGDGRYIGADADGTPDDSTPPPIESQKVNGSKPPSEKVVDNEINVEAYEKLMALDGEKVFEAAMNTFNQLNAAGVDQPFEPVVGTDDEAKRANAEFVARFVA